MQLEPHQPFGSIEHGQSLEPSFRSATNFKVSGTPLGVGPRQANRSDMPVDGLGGSVRLAVSVQGRTLSVPSLHMHLLDMSTELQFPAALWILAMLLDMATTQK